MKKFYFLLIFFCILFEYSCTNEYFDFHNKNTQYEDQKEKISKWAEKFDISKIEERDLEIFSTPDKLLIDKFVNYIVNAKKRVYLEVYTLTEKRIIQALNESKKKWVDVKVILEKNVVWSSSINKKAFESLKNNWVQVVYANDINYKFTHSKLFIIDDFYIIGTGNMTHSTFITNREFFILWNHNEDIKILEEIFSNDFVWNKFNLCNINLIIPPICSRFKIEDILKSAKKSIYIYAQSIEDDNIKNIIIQKSKEDKEIQIMLWDKTKLKWNQKLIDELNSYKIKIVSPKKPYIHAKVFVVDEKYIYIWSINYTANSMDNNREIWIVFINNKIWSAILNLFSKDINSL